MPLTMPVTTQERDLDDSEAALLWNWLLSRQGLAPRRKFSSIVDLAYASLGLHAARLPSPYATALARGTTPQVAASLLTPQAHADLITVRCMRKTLHTLPLPLASAAHAATLYFRERDAQRAITNAGVSMSAINTTIDAIVNLLLEGQLPHRVIEASLTSSRRSVTTIRLALKLAWERGILTYINAAGCWNKEHRTFAVTTTRHPTLDMARDRDAATTELIATYFDRYGPATLKDAMWWSGLSRTTILAAMAESHHEWLSIFAPWSPSPMFMYQHRWEEFQASTADVCSPALNFLAHEDVSLKAYFETRGRYLGSLPAKRAFNQIGEVHPTITLNGQVIGTWSWQAAAKRVTYSLAQGRSTAKQRKEIETLATALSEALRLGWSSAPRHAAENQLTLL